MIVTVPHKILQIDMIRFTPPMPPTKRAAIQRVRMGNLKLGRLRPGEWRYLEDREVAMLQGPEKKPASTPLNRRK